MGSTKAISLEEIKNEAVDLVYIYINCNLFVLSKRVELVRIGFQLSHLKIDWYKPFEAFDHTSKLYIHMHAHFMFA